MSCDVKSCNVLSCLVLHGIALCRTYVCICYMSVNADDIFTYVDFRYAVYTVYVYNYTCRFQHFFIVCIYICIRIGTWKEAGASGYSLPVATTMKSVPQDVARPTPPAQLRPASAAPRQTRQGRAAGGCQRSGAMGAQRRRSGDSLRQEQLKTRIWADWCGFCWGISWKDHWDLTSGKLT